MLDKMSDIEPEEQDFLERRLDHYARSAGRLNEDRDRVEQAVGAFCDMYVQMREKGLLTKEVHDRFHHDWLEAMKEARGRGKQPEYREDLNNP